MDVLRPPPRTGLCQAGFFLVLSRSRPLGSDPGEGYLQRSRTAWGRCPEKAPAPVESPAIHSQDKQHGLRQGEQHGLRQGAPGPAVWPIPAQPSRLRALPARRDCAAGVPKWYQRPSAQRIRPSSSRAIEFAGQQPTDTDPRLGPDTSLEQERVSTTHAMHSDPDHASHHHRGA